MLTFDPILHEYRIDGRFIPSVTYILKSVNMTTNYAAVDPLVLQRAAERGTAVHKAIEYLNGPGLDWGSLHPDLIPYVQAYQKFTANHVFDYLYGEKILYSEQWDYAGTPDLIGYIDGVLTLLDIKCTYELDEPGVEVQLAGYEQLWNENRYNHAQVNQIAALHLRRDGTFYLHVCNDGEAWPLFTYALMITQWRLKHKRC